MRIRILCVGRMKAGPERELVDDYISRARKVGAGSGWKAVEEIECAPGGGKDKEAERLLEKHADGSVLVLLDEHAKPWTSQDFSEKLARWRDDGREVEFAIGGADGHGAAVRAKATEKLAFGPQTWPHKLVRVMLAEQIYRALSIEAGTPYHRE